MCGDFSIGDPRVGLAELQAQPVVHDVIHHPQRGRGDAGRKLADLNSVELIDIDDRLDGERQLCGCSPVHHPRKSVPVLHRPGKSVKH